MELVEKLVQKSEEAFIVGIELYNKPTIKYRVEGFSFFICNAWELLLKAYLIQSNGESSIYYSDSPNRTITLDNCIKKVFTNDKDPLRKNLEKIIDLRNTSTHFITEEYEQIYVPLFQASVLNYINKLLQYFGIDITENLGSNFLTLSVKMTDLNTETIKARYPKQISDKILASISDIGKSIGSTDNMNFAIPIRHEFYITKNSKLSTAQFSITKDADQAAFILKELHDMQKDCPYQMKKCLDIINKRITKDNINFINPVTHNELKRNVFNSYCFNLFAKFYNLKVDKTYCYIYNRNSIANYSYSMKAINLILEQIKKDPEHIIQDLRSKIGKSTPGAKEF